MNKDLHFSSKKTDWETPDDFFAKLDRMYHFTLDVCATKKNAKCKQYYTPKQDAFTQSWTGRIWMNPPYGRQIDKWIQRAWLAAITGEAEIVVCLLPARTDTRWFHDYICTSTAVKIEYIRGRLQFKGAKYKAPFPSMVVVFQGQNK